MLLADEPTANLDYINAESIVALLRDLRSKGRLIIVSTHDQRLIPIADRVVRMVPESAADAGPPQRVEYAAQETIFEQGSRGELIYVISSGEVEIARTHADGSEALVAVLGPGEYFGELGPLLGFPRSATARARRDVMLIAYGVRDFREQVLGDLTREPEARTIVLDAPKKKDGARTRGASAGARSAPRRRSISTPTRAKPPRPRDAPPADSLQAAPTILRRAASRLPPCPRS
jgi:putative ABC transport system ATP-binding protein